MREFIGVDPSLTGFAVQHSLGGRVKAFQIKTKPGDFGSFPERLNFIMQEFSRFLSGAANYTSFAAIEGFSMGSKQGSSKSIECHAVAMCARLELWRAGISFIEVPPSTLKKWISGKGNAEKNLMLREVYKRWQYEAPDDNDADAYALVKLAEWWQEVAEGTRGDLELKTWRSISKACNFVPGTRG